MFSFIVLIVLIISLGGMLFIAARKLTVLSSLAIETESKTKTKFGSDENLHKKKKIFFVKTEKIKFIFSKQNIANLKSKIETLKNLKIKREKPTEGELQKLEEIDKGHDYWEKIKKKKLKKK